MDPFFQKEIEKQNKRVYNYPILLGRRRNMAAKAKSRRIRERRKHLGAWGILLIVLFVFGASTVAGIRLKQKNLTYQQREEALQQSIDKEEARSQEVDDLEAYTKTKKYVEDVAKDKLGLVYEDEIIFKAKNK